MADEEGRQPLKKSSEKKGDQKVSFFKLFSFADRFDVALIVVGTISAMANGMTQPLMTLIFGQLINSFGGASQSDVVHEVSQVILPCIFAFLGLKSWFLCWDFVIFCVLYILVEFLAA